MDEGVLGVGVTPLARGLGGREALPSVSSLRGWFQIGWSVDFGGQPRPMRYFGRDLVAYRTEAGELIVLDANCQHLGAHLGYGGTVEGDCIVCPFHGWKWDRDGANTDIPYSTKVKRNRAKRLRSWHVREQEGVVYLWHDPADRGPTWEPPILLDEGEEYHDLHPDGVWTWERVRVHPQMSMENTTDAAHFKYVHRADEVGHIAAVRTDDRLFEAEYTLGMGRGDRKTFLAEGPGVVVATLMARAWGVGLLTAHFSGPGSAVNLLCTTPIDAHSSRMMSSVWVPRSVDAAVVGLRIREQVKQIGRDIVIWEHMDYLARPPFPPEEARDFVALRRWSEQFYVGNGTDAGRPADREGPS